MIAVRGHPNIQLPVLISTQPTELVLSRLTAMLSPER
jgi:hypothetical protein